MTLLALNNWALAIPHPGSLVLLACLNAGPGVISSDPSSAITFTEIGHEI